MHKLMMTTALVVPLLAAPAVAQEAPPPRPEAEAEQTAPMPEGAAADAEVEVTTEEPAIEINQEDPAVEITQQEPEVEVVQEEPVVEVIREGDAAEGEQPEMAEEPAAGEEPAVDTPALAEEPAADAPELAEEPTGPTPEAVVSQMDAEELRGDWVIGTDVVSPEDEAIGQIEDVIITSDGQITAAILSVGGFLGLGAKNIAVDWNELQIAEDGREIMLDLTREEAEAAPEYAFRDQVQPEPAADAAAPMAAPEPEPAAPAQ